MKRAFLIATLLVSTLAPATALAQPSSADEQEARATFQAARLSYENGRYEDAYGMFARAHELSGRHILLYNMGQAADRARMDDEAIDAFDRYLANDAEVDETLRPEVVQRLQGLRAAREREARREVTAADIADREARIAAEHDRLANVPTPEEAARAAQPNPLIAADEPEEESSNGKWIVIGIVAAVVVAGGVTAALLLRDPGIQDPLPPNTGIIVEALR